ncbi:hypothetical protein P8452_66836 [Trifolium repens]|nr:hypothetical protein P8452_66836 [Trifolium repens]
MHPHHLSSSPSFFISHPSLFHHSWINLHHHWSLPPLLSLPPLPSTDEIQSPSHTIDPLHYLQQAFSPSHSSSPSAVLQQTSNLEKRNRFVKSGGWKELYRARGRTCSETVSKQGEVNDDNCNNGYCSGCISSIVLHASELNTVHDNVGYKKMVKIQEKDCVGKDTTPIAGLGFWMCSCFILDLHFRFEHN